MPPSLEHLVQVPDRRVLPPAADVAGADLWGRRADVRVATLGCWTLLLFLGSRCDGCAPFWPAVDDPASLGLHRGDTVRVVTHDAGREDAAAVRALLGDAGAASLAVMSSAAWRAYGVQGPPFFSLVDGAAVRSEGVCWSVGQVAADVERARRGDAAPAFGELEGLEREE
ncbi:MAG: hypothetical protein ACRDWE_14675 [Acidimicrobiales bacterium]